MTGNNKNTGPGNISPNGSCYPPWWTITPNAYQRYVWDQNYMSAENGYTGSNHVQYYKYGLHIILIYTQNLEYPGLWKLD